MHLSRRLLPLCLVLAAAQPTSAQWVGFQEHDGLAWFLFEHPARIERYDIANHLWLDPIALASSPTAFRVDADGLYVALGGSVWRMDANGGNAEQLVDTPTDITALLIWSEFLYVIHPDYPYGNLLSVDKHSGAAIDSIQLTYQSYAGASLSPTHGRIYGRYDWLSPDDILMLTLLPDGTFGDSVDSPYHGGFPTPRETFVFPGRDLVGDGSGTVYHADELTYQHSFGGPVDAIVFQPDGSLVVLRDHTLLAFSDALLETGRLQLDVDSVRNISVQGEDVILFASQSSAPNVAVFKVPVSDLRPEEPELVPQLYGMPLTPDGVFLDRDNILYLFSRQHSALFRWSMAQREFIEGIGLIGAPEFVAYSPVNHQIYLANENGHISRIQLDDSLRQQPFVNLPTSAMGLAAAGEFVFASYPSDSWVKHSIYHPDGTRLEERDLTHYSREYVWSPVNRRMYFFRDDTIPNDLLFVEITAEGQFGEQVESPYHGEIQTIHPIRVRPDAGVVLIGSGELFHPTTLVRFNSLGNGMSDASWRGSTLFTLRDLGGRTELQAWSDTYSPTAVAELGGRPLRLWALPDAFLIVTVENTQTRMTLLNDSFEILYQTPLNLAPTGITLNPSTVYDTLEIGETVGTLSALDADPGDTHEFVLIDDANGHFHINGQSLILNASLLPNTAHTIVVRATDPGGLSVQSSLVISVIEYIPPPPLGELTIDFNDLPSALVQTQTWHEKGFTLQTGPLPFSLAEPDPDGAGPFHGSPFLRFEPHGQSLQITHRSGELFRLFSVRLASLPESQRPASVLLVGRRVTGQLFEYRAWLHGAVDGPGGVEDFQVFHLPDSFANLIELTVTGNGFALDDASMFVGPVPTPPLVRLQPNDLVAFEHPGPIAETPPFPHTARVEFIRVGNLNQQLTCHLSLGGTATYAEDYYIEGLGPDRTITFAPGQAAISLQLFPITDTVADDRETVLIRLEPAAAYTRSATREALITIYENPYDAWIAERWPGLDSASPLAQPGADPDRSKLSNLAEFVLGMEPRNPASLARPILSVQDGAVTLRIPRSVLARDREYRIESSDHLAAWEWLDLEPTVTDPAPNMELLHYTLPDAFQNRFFHIFIPRAP